MPKYDDAFWHYGGDFPKELPKINGFFHIAYFLNWCIEMKLISEDCEEAFDEELKKVRNNKISAVDYLEIIDEKFTDEDLTEVGNAFANDYYDSESNSEFSNEVSNFATDYLIYIEKVEQENKVNFETMYHFDYSIDHCQNLNKIFSDRFELWQKKYQ